MPGAALSRSRNASRKQSSASKRRCRCLVRALHVLLSGGVLSSLLLCRNSHLRRMFADGELLAASLYLVLFGAALVAYMVTSLMNPGYVDFPDWQRKSRKRAGAPGEDDSEDEDAARDATPLREVLSGDSREPPPKPPREQQLKLRFCRFCLIDQPLRARHCEDCARCVAKFDHHCPWLENCVGERNHRAFLLFTWLQSALVWWSVSLVGRSFGRTAATWSAWLAGNLAFVGDLLVLVLAGVPLLFLLAFHSYLALTNSTTWESVSRERISYLKHLGQSHNPFHMGYCRNCWLFCCSCAPVRWNALYSVATDDYHMGTVFDGGAGSANDDDEELLLPSTQRPPRSASFL